MVWLDEFRSVICDVVIMADFINPQEFYGQTPEMIDIARKQRMAQMLMQQSQMPQGQMISGHYVAPNPAQMLASALGQYKGLSSIKSADEQAKQIAQGLQQQRQTWMGEMPRATPNTSDQGPVVPQQPSAEDYTSWAMRGMQIDPKAAAMGMQSANLAMNREAQAQSRAEARQARIDNLNAQHQLRMDALAAQNANAKQMAEANREHQMALARLQAELRPEPLQPVLIPGSQQPVLLPRSQAIGMQPWNPQAAKTQQQIEDKEKGKQTVSDVVGELKGYYDTLKSEGGITSTGGSPSTNLRARIANTGVGQLAGSIAGTKAQQARESISQTRPLLMAAIKNATGMSAQQMNSNAELMFYMQAATDPSKGYEANMDAIRRLDKMYGLGLHAKDEPKTQGGVTFLGFE